MPGLRHVTGLTECNFLQRNQHITMKPASSIVLLKRNTDFTGDALWRRQP